MQLLGVNCIGNIFAIACSLNCNYLRATPWTRKTSLKVAQ